MNHRLSLLKGARRRRIRNDERGSIFPYLCIACGALAMVALLLMLSLGDTTLHRRDASNAADAAALAAAHPRIVRTEILRDLGGIDRVVVGYTE